MAISHVCLSCGFDLARVRARLDPYYALPLVLCPDCGTAGVRRKPRLRRSFTRLLFTLVVLAVQLALLAASLAAVVGMSVDLGGVTVRGDFGVMSGQDILLRVGAYAALAVAVGAWLTAGFGHVRRTRAWLVFTTFAAIVLLLGCIQSDLGQLPARLLTLGVVMTVAAAGVPLGMAAVVTGRSTRRMLWNARRRRLRARSAGR